MLTKTVPDNPFWGAKTMRHISRGFLFHETKVMQSYLLSTRVFNTYVTEELCLQRWFPSSLPELATVVTISVRKSQGRPSPSCTYYLYRILFIRVESVVDKVFRKRCNALRVVQASLKSTWSNLFNLNFNVRKRPWGYSNAHLIHFICIVSIPL